MESITLGVREGAGQVSQRQRFMPRFTFSSVLLGFILSILFYILPASNCGDTFYSPIYIGTDSFGINYKLHELGFEYGFSG